MHLLASMAVSLNMTTNSDVESVNGASVWRAREDEARKRNTLARLDAATVRFSRVQTDHTGAAPGALLVGA